MSVLSTWIDIDDPPQIIVSLKHEHNLIARLDHLKRIRVEHETRYAHWQALGFRIVLG